jgi:5-methylcytosine-specific restriction endonuclease McrA
MKRCKACGVEKPLSDFHKNPKTRDRYCAKCKTCRRQQHLEYAAACKAATPVLDKKVCLRCSIEKPRSAFYEGANKTGLRSYCIECWRKECHKQYEDHLPRRLSNAATYRKNNPEKVKAAVREWYQKNKEYHKAQTLAWNRAHPKQHLAISKKYRYNKRKNGGLGLTLAQIAALQRSPCHYCGATTNVVQGVVRCMEIDHVIPVSKGGKTEINNVVPACRTCNAKKHNKVLDANMPPVLQ